MTHTVLVAEDDEDDRFLIAEALKSFNFDIENVLFFENGLELINYLKKNEKSTALLILDLNMPIMNGYETLEVIQKDSELNKIPIVCLTSSNLENDQRFCKEYGVKKFLTKPSSFVDLTNMLQSALSSISC